jgi:hypothetical protein
VYERTAGNSGFLGTWDSESAKVRSGIELQIQPYEGDGLSFKRSDEATPKMRKFDGSEHPDLDPNAAYSGRRVNELTLEITEKLQGKITGTRQIELSRDLKTLTMTVRLVGQSKPQSILVFDREKRSIAPILVGAEHKQPCFPARRSGQKALAHGRWQPQLSHLGAIPRSRYLTHDSPLVHFCWVSLFEERANKNKFRTSRDFSSAARQRTDGGRRPG